MTRPAVRTGKKRLSRSRWAAGTAGGGAPPRPPGARLPMSHLRAPPSAAVLAANVSASGLGGCGGKADLGWVLSPPAPDPGYGDCWSPRASLPGQERSRRRGVCPPLREAGAPRTRKWPQPHPLSFRRPPNLLPHFLRSRLAQAAWVEGNEKAWGPSLSGPAVPIPLLSEMSAFSDLQAVPFPYLHHPPTPSPFPFSSPSR